ncbi:MAG: alginate lyase family protein, partial [Pyrinomonadaceae bacterium]
MTDRTMAKPLDKIKKIRSLSEVFTRSGQAISVYREKRSGGGQIPSDVEFSRLVDVSKFGDEPIVAEILKQRFFENGETRFFPSFKHRERSISALKDIFGDELPRKFISAAENILDGRVDLMGLTNLYVGTEIDWHREPLSAKRSPLKHWKLFDDLDSRETGNKKIVWELNRHQHFFTLGVAYWLTNDERFAEIFARQIESWIDENPPGMGINWASSLEVSFRAISWIWALQFFRDSPHLTADLFNKVLKVLYLHGRHIERYLSKYYSPNTHLTGEALGLYYLGTQLPFLARAAHWRKLGEDILFAEISKQVMADGVYFEQSTWYQRYTADFFAHFVVLKALYGGGVSNSSAVDLENRLEQTFDFLMHATMPDGRTPIIGDDDGGRMLPLTTAAPDDFRGTLAVSAVIFDRADHKYVSGKPSQELLWLLGPDAIGFYENLPSAWPRAGSADFGHGGYCVMRDGWCDTDNFLMVDCGPVGSLAGGHGHADALSVEMAIHGKTILVDSGTYTYHESPELRDYFRSTTAHNTLVIDGASSSEPGNAFGWHSRAKAKKRTWISEDRFDLFEGFHDGYKRLTSQAMHSRSILFLKNDYFIMRDLVETTGEHEYSLNFHIAEELKPKIADDGKWVGDRDFRLFTFGDNGSWKQNESWISNNHAKRTNAPFLRYISKGTGTQEFFTFILPADRRGAEPDVTEVPSASGRAFLIKYSGYTDVFVFNDDRSVPIDNGIFVSNFKYSWARLSNGEAVPDELVLIDGNRLAIGGQEIFAPHDANYASIL